MVKKVFEEVVELPAGVTLVVDGSIMAVSGNGKNPKAKFNNRSVSVKITDGKVMFKTIGKSTRPKVASAGAAVAHLYNLLKSLKQDFSKHVQVLYAHFPVSIEITGKNVLIKNFLGEKVPRKAKIVGDTKIEVKGPDIFVTGPDIYSVGQTTQNLITATKITGKDRRVFQDGIYPIEE